MREHPRDHPWQEPPQESLWKDPPWQVHQGICPMRLLSGLFLLVMLPMLLPRLPPRLPLTCLSRENQF